jgi:hypothetical protein
VLVYVAAAAAFVAVAPREGSRGALAAGTTAAVVVLAVDALAGHLFPDRATFDPQASFRLAGQLDYSNALGILAALGLLLALGFVGHARSAAARALAGASVVLLATTLYLTFSRGSVLAFAAGSVVLVALEPRRLAVGLRVAPTAAVALLAVWLASRQTALTTEGYPYDAAARDGHRLAAILAVLILAGAAAGALSRLPALAPSRERFATLALGLLAVVIVIVAAAQVTRAAGAFDRRPPATGGDLNRRLLSVSSDWRSSYWRVAWREWRDHPVLGGGAGSWQRAWLRDRPADITVRNAHNVYLETLAELGPLGLALLLAALAAPFRGGAPCARESVRPHGDRGLRRLPRPPRRRLGLADHRGRSRRARVRGEPRGVEPRARARPAAPARGRGARRGARRPRGLRAGRELGGRVEPVGVGPPRPPGGAGASAQGDPLAAVVGRAVAPARPGTARRRGSRGRAD